ncbi:MAG TPA: monovalent cation/H+ antiporter subunit D family protein, partial [Rhodospirillales bacterium]|nr:monovalent cation/H+ antiporter subunit D family protein [Rhodospirillales bacterium]
MITPHLPILQIILPLMAAPVAIILRRPGATWALATVITWIAFAIALMLMMEVLANGPLNYRIGG